ncbi:MAG TPA: DUF192 domain-containing protein [Acidimicrobiales bacterium]|nr:DUF192 domain-containing protein [Acidimicrobiales bacterium]
MTWLVREGEVLASLEVADTMSSRMAGLLGRDGIDGAMLIKPARSVHTIGMQFPIDVAFCDGQLQVVAVRCMVRNRIGLPRLRARCVIEAEAGAFERWGLKVGDRLEVTG